MNNKELITVSVSVNASLEKAWNYFTLAEYITQWYFASADWHCPKAENNCISGGTFLYRMEAKDGSFGFDFFGKYSLVNPQEKIESILGDDRIMNITFKSLDKNTTLITETFEAEKENPIELQQNGWQAILDNFKLFVENQAET